MRYKRIIISDLHLGSKASRGDDIANFLELNSTDELILNGDVIDGWSLKRGGQWRKRDTKVLRRILKYSQKGTNIIWIKGNHDEFVKDFLPLIIGNIKVCDNYFFESENIKYFVFHGDVLDFFITKAKWIGILGSIGYDFLLWINRRYNWYRSLRGLPYYSISKDIKSGIKKATNFINDFESNAIKLAKKNGADTAICGHIHHAEIKDSYMNSGDWCESCTALVETYEGKWELIEYHKKVE
ncbi:MAG: UDP-2,3-diacylglucosamine diphosphatase [Candidatus Pacearchaeota archaeon]|jgi:UDP-2,3-diacylglucosamine pyrophosphatase LpxH|nr:UDP-2,3-diacylglucosamine diphosphatase [Clostridia bacterium]